MSTNEKTSINNVGQWQQSVDKLKAEFDAALAKGVQGVDAEMLQKLKQLAALAKEGADAGKIDVREVAYGAFQGDNGQKIVDSVYQMTYNVNSLELSFARAHSLLLTMDGHKYKRPDGSLIQNAATWNEYHLELNRALTASKNVASEGVVYTQRYAREIPEKLAKLQAILDDPVTETETLEETKKRATKTMKIVEASINVLIKDMKTTENEATKLAGRFSDLANNVTIFADKLNADVTALLTANAAEVKEARAEVAKCQKALDEIKGTLADSFTSLFSSGGVAAGAGLAGCVAGALCASAIVPGAIFVVAGLSFFAMLGSGGAVASYAGQVSAAEVQLKMAKDKLAEKELMEKNLLESEAAVKQILADKDNIIERLGKIMTIWSTVQSDAIQLQKWLSSCLNPETPVETIVEALDNSHIGSIYTILGQILQVYASQVHASALEAPKPI